MWQQSLLLPARTAVTAWRQRLTQGGRSALLAAAPRGAESERRRLLALPLRRMRRATPSRRLRLGGLLRFVGRRSEESRQRRGTWAWGLGLSFLAGALVMFLLDPRMGRRRRALVRDKGASLYRFLTRRLPTATRKRSIWVRDRLRGMTYELRHAVARDGRRAPDDVELAQRVRSEVFRDRAIPDGAINVDAHEGVVTLRGELPSADLIERVVEATERVEGVRRVRSLLHPPPARTAGPPAEAGGEPAAPGQPETP